MGVGIRYIQSPLFSNAAAAGCKALHGRECMIWKPGGCRKDKTWTRESLQTHMSKSLEVLRSVHAKATRIYNARSMWIQVLQEALIASSLPPFSTDAGTKNNKRSRMQVVAFVNTQSLSNCIYKINHTSAVPHKQAAEAAVYPNRQHHLSHHSWCVVADAAPRTSPGSGSKTVAVPSEADLDLGSSNLATRQAVGVAEERAFAFASFSACMRDASRTECRGGEWRRRRCRRQ